LTEKMPAAAGKVCWAAARGSAACFAKIAADLRPGKTRPKHRCRQPGSSALATAKPAPRDQSSKSRGRRITQGHIENHADSGTNILPWRSRHAKYSYVPQHQLSPTTWRRSAALMRIEWRRGTRSGGRLFVCRVRSEEGVFRLRVFCGSLLHKITYDWVRPESSHESLVPTITKCSPHAAISQACASRGPGLPPSVSCSRGTSQFAALTIAAGGVPARTGTLSLIALPRYRDKPCPRRRCLFGPRGGAFSAGREHLPAVR
jgi:hypothetical protein